MGARLISRLHVTGCQTSHEFGRLRLLVYRNECGNHHVNELSTHSIRRGGGRFAPAPAICQTNGPILDPETAFDSSGLALSEYVAKFHLHVTGDVTGRVKGHFLIPVNVHFPGHSSHIRLK